MKVKIIKPPKPYHDVVQTFINNCPPGTPVMVRVSPYVIDVKDSGRVTMAKEAYDGTIVKTKPFMFCHKWSVKVEGFNGQPIHIDRIKPFKEAV